jgi:short-subunit dehydrogenase
VAGDPGRRGAARSAWDHRSDRRRRLGCSEKGRDVVESLRGRVGVVTGASRGIGRVIADELAASGMSLLLIARGGAELRPVADELVDRYGVRCLPAAIDVTDRAAIDRIMMHAEQQLGAIDLLVNNARTIESAAQPFWADDPDETWRVVATNLRGPLLMTHAVLGAMIARGRGHVVTVAGRARAATEIGAYTGYLVAEHAASVLTRALAAQLRGTGVIAVDVLPGLVRTDSTRSMPVRDDAIRWDSPEATARVVAEIARGRFDDRAGETIDAPAEQSRTSR